MNFTPPPPVACNDLAEQGNFPDSICDQLPASGYYIRNCPASFFATRVRDNAKCAILIAPLHNTDVRAHRFFSISSEQMLPNSGLAAMVFRGINSFFPATLENIIQIIGGAVKLLSAYDQIHVGQPINEFLSSALRHAAHKSQHHIRPT